MSEPKYIELSELKPDDLNANAGTERGMKMLLDSLKKFGAARSILIDKNGKIIAGNKTAEQAAKAGITKVRVIQTTGRELVAVKRPDVDLDTPEGRELAIADNRVAQVNLEYDPAAIDKLLASGVVNENFFLDHELEKLLGRKVERADEGGGAAVRRGAGEKEEEPEAPKSNVQGVQIFFDQETFEQFEAVIERLEKFFDTTQLADTVTAAMRFVRDSSAAASAE